MAVKNAKHRLFEILEGSVPGDRAGQTFGVFIVTLITLNVLAFIFETVPGLARDYGRWFQLFEWFSVAIFTAEYLLRIYTCVEDPRFRDPVRGRLRFAVTPLALVDLLAILPSFLVLLPRPFVVDLRFIRVLRFFRLLRLFKLGRYSESMQTLGSVLRAKREELGLALVVVVVLLVITSSFMYFAEHQAQPQTFSSIPASMWWAIITLTTIGYGDAYPITTLGRVLGAVTALLGIGMVALPTAILSMGFLDEIQKKKGKKEEPCPHCGRNIHAPPEPARRLGPVAAGSEVERRLNKP